MTDYEPGSCVVGSKPHRAVYGLTCGHHFDQLGKMLRSIEDEAVHLEIKPSMAIGYDNPGGGLASEQSPVRLVAAVLSDDRRGTGMTVWSENDEIAWDDTPSALETLHSRARTVREERNMTEPVTTVMLGRDTRPPDLHGPVCDWICWHDSCGPWITDTVRADATLAGERDFLTRQLPWICEQPWVDEFYDELRSLLTALRRANNTLELPVGRCDSLLPSGKLCDGKVWHTEIRHDDGPDEPGFRCGSCRRVWTGTEAVRLRDRMWRDEQERKAAG